MKKDIRGIDLKADNFKTQLISLINDSNLPSSLVMYILKDMLNEVSVLYTQSAANQYEEFCKAAAQENDEPAAADSDNIDDK